jgi:hypothetical protein
MNTEPKSYAPKHDAKDISKIKTLEVRLSMNHRDLEVEVRKAFDLAKSAGHELNLTFNHGSF